AQGNGPYPPQMLLSSCCPDRPNVPWAAAYFDLLDDFFLGMRAPDLRASLSATATACLRLVTFLPLPDFRLPSLNSCITFLTFPLPLLAFFWAIAILL